LDFHYDEYHYMNTKLLLYGTSACHLCEEAESLLQSLDDVTWHSIDVADNNELLARYGLRIPLVVRPNGDELGWPFDLSTLIAFIGG
jgi:hypothetical protein